MYVALLLLLHAAELILCFWVAHVLVGIVFRLQNHRPTSWEDIVVDIQVIRFEEKASEDRYNSQILAIGKVDDVLRRGHDVQYKLGVVQVGCLARYDSTRTESLRDVSIYRRLELYRA